MVGMPSIFRQKQGGGGNLAMDLGTGRRVQILKWRVQKQHARIRYQLNPDSEALSFFARNGRLVAAATDDRIFLCGQVQNDQDVLFFVLCTWHQDV